MRIERTPETIRLLEMITGPASLTGPTLSRLILNDGHCRRINGRYIVGNVLTPDEHGRPKLRHNGDHTELVTRRHRFLIPKNHPWRGKRP